MNFTPQAAFDYIKSKLDDFYVRGNTLQDQEIALNQLIVLYQQSGLDETEVDTLFGQVNDELLRWQMIANRLTPILGYFGYSPPGLGIDPITLTAISATVIAVAVLLWQWYYSSRIDANSAAIRVLASKVNLSSADQAVIDKATTAPGFFSSLFSGAETISNYLLIGGAIYLGILLLRR